jgi:hypothetical protein
MRNLVIEEVLAPWGLLHQKKKVKKFNFNLSPQESMWGRRGIAPIILNITPRSLYPWKRSWVAPTAGMDVSGKRKNLLSLGRFERQEMVRKSNCIFF